jgi:hypothetical protein
MIILCADTILNVLRNSAFPAQRFSFHELPLRNGTPRRAYSYGNMVVYTWTRTGGERGGRQCQQGNPSTVSCYHDVQPGICAHRLGPSIPILTICLAPTATHNLLRPCFMKSSTPTQQMSAPCRSLINHRRSSKLSMVRPARLKPLEWLPVTGIM